MSASLCIFPSNPVQNGFAFPESLTEKYRPRQMSDFVGLDKAKTIFRNLAMRPRSGGWIFYGPSGTGKTTFALAFAASIPAEVHHIPSQECDLQTITSVCKRCNYMPMAGYRFHVILIDEADRMSEAAQIALLSKLDSTAAPPDTIFILTCNSVDRLQDRLLSRLGTVDFSSYGIAKSAASLLADVWSKEAPEGAPAPNFDRIVKDSKNNIRTALMALDTELLAI